MRAPLCVLCGKPGGDVSVVLRGRRLRRLTWHRACADRDQLHPLGCDVEAGYGRIVSSLCARHGNRAASVLASFLEGP